MKTKNSLIMSVIITLFLSSCAQNTTVTTVPNVDLNQYLGKWYEIATIPQSFQKGCNCTTAEYSLSDKGYVIVKNSCNKGSVTGKRTTAEGKAFVVKNSGNAKLKVQFFWPFKGDYWIIDLAKDYSYAVVGDPSKKYLWILSRTPQMSETTYQEILTRIAAMGYDLSTLVKTKQCE